MQHRTFALVVSALVAPLVVPAVAMADVVWRGDFESGDRGQFSKEEKVHNDRLQVVTSPTRQGKFALRAEVRQGDDPINASGNRNELVFFDNSREGSDYYYGWSTLWPADYPLQPAWQVMMQWHHPGCCGAPPIRFVLGCSAADCGQAMPDTLFLIVDGKTVWKKTPITLGEWQDFILHVKWSASASQGFVELWHNGEQVLPKTFTRTMFSSSDVNYLKLGLYRDESIRPTGVIFHDGLVQTTTLEEAMAALPPPDAPAAPEEAAAPPSTTLAPEKLQAGAQPEGNASTSAVAASSREPTPSGSAAPVARPGGCSSGGNLGLGLLALGALGPWLRRRRKPKRG